jgi:hypothetical protein
MKSSAAKLASFAAVLAVAFGAAALAGAAIDPERADAPAPGHGGGGMAIAHAESVRGLASVDDDLRLVVDNSQLRRGARELLTFRVVDAAGATVRDFDVEHAKRMHLIAVRRDLTGFQHLHPAQRADGSWAVHLRLPAAGTYRLFAEFARGGEPHTLGYDVAVDGPARARALPAPSTVAHVDGYDVRLDDELDLSVTRGGAPVRLQEYLGASGHLVVIREGDLAFLHVHPAGDSFDAEFPTPGRYRLFLQFKADGRVHTAAFTREVS